VVDAIGKIELLGNRTGIIVLVTDCYERPELLGRAVDALRMHGHDVIVFHVVDPAERDLPGDDDTTFEDAESGLLLPLKPADLRARYQALIGAHHTALQSRFTAAGADYVRLDTSEPLDRALHAYLDARLSRSRVR
jgi:fructoselysine-6-P-deglycase FrlB-like protein